MGYGSQGITKLAYGSYLAASLAYLMNRQRDAVGFIAFDDNIVTHVPPSARPGHLRSVLLALNQLSLGTRSNVAKPLHQLADSLVKRGIVVLLSDLLDDPARTIQGLKHLRFRGSSPGRYCRYSANSTLKPLNGLLCNPARNPSTTVRARNSIEPIRAMRDGSRKRSSPPDAFIGMLHLTPRRRDRFEKLSHQLVGIDILRLRVEVRDDSVAKNRRCQRRDITNRDMEPPVHECPGLATENQRLRGA